VVAEPVEDRGVRETGQTLAGRALVVTAVDEIDGHEHRWEVFYSTGQTTSVTAQRFSP
jgi:hypothetical protein